MRYGGPYPGIPGAERIGVLLVNLGTPDSPQVADVRRYLAEFLADPRVVEMARLPWWLILHGVILRTRPRRSAAAYAKVWGEQGSPLLAIGRRQAIAMQEALAATLGGQVQVELAMRYGNPSLADALERLRQGGAGRVVVLPLYPQYAAATTASTFDGVSRVLRGWRWLPELHFITRYHDHPAYLDALAQSVRDHWAAHGEPERLLLSFHGIPKAYADGGDPYPQQCEATAQALMGRLGLPPERWLLSYQSRLGRAEWLRPYTDQTLEAWGKAGVGRVDVVCPGFAADCLETLEEIAQENRHLFQQAGGGEYHYIPALNDRPDHIAALAGLVLGRIGALPAVPR
jgi:protoporphyrin/coproporphyrin ferrochelatase